MSNPSPSSEESDEQAVFTSVLSLLLLDVAYSAHSSPSACPCPPPPKRLRLNSSTTLQTPLQTPLQTLPIPEPIGVIGNGDSDIYGRITPKDPSKVEYMQMKMTSSQTEAARASPSIPILEPTLKREGGEKKKSTERLFVHDIVRV